MQDTERTDGLGRSMVSRRARWAQIATGVAAAFGLSATGLVLGALVAVAGDRLEVPDSLFRSVWVTATAVFVVGAGMSVRELAREQATIAVLLATVLFAAAVSAVMDSIESVGIDGNEFLFIGVSSSVFGAFLLLGVGFQRRREPGPLMTSPNR